MNNCTSVSNKSIPPIMCIVGFSNSGKTTVMVGLISELRNRGLRIAAIKHDVHGFEMDKPGKDTWRQKRAGAEVTIISSPHQIGMVKDVRHDHHPLELATLIDQEIDIILAEGFKSTDLPKIEVFRPENGKPPACKDDPFLIAVVSDSEIGWNVPLFRTDDYCGIADFIVDYFSLKAKDSMVSNPQYLSDIRNALQFSHTKEM